MKTIKKKIRKPLHLMEIKNLQPLDKNQIDKQKKRRHKKCTERPSMRIPLC